MNGQETIAGVIRKLLKRVFIMVVAVVAIALPANVQSVMANSSFFILGNCFLIDIWRQKYPYSHTLAIPKCRYSTGIWR